MITVTVNGEASQLADPQTIRDLLQNLGYAGKRIAVERNGEIVPKSRHGETPIADGDQLEIVVAVGGG
jgi:sulfur carrier protein